MGSHTEVVDADTGQLHATVNSAKEFAEAKRQHLVEGLTSTAEELAKESRRLRRKAAKRARKQARRARAHVVDAADDIQKRLDSKVETLTGTAKSSRARKSFVVLVVAAGVIGLGALVRALGS